MRPSSSSLIRIQPIVAPSGSSSSSLSAITSRLPPPLKQQYAARRRASQPSSSSTEAHSSTTSPATQQQQQSRPRAPQSIVALHQEAERSAEAAAAELEAVGVEGGMKVKSGWPKNLRVLEFVEKRERFWKVPKEQRDILKKVLREE